MTGHPALRAFCLGVFESASNQEWEQQVFSTCMSLSEQQGRTAEFDTYASPRGSEQCSLLVPGGVGAFGQ